MQCKLTAIRAERQPRGTTPAESVRLATFRPGPRVESRLRRAAACVPPPAQHRVTVPLQLQLYIVESTTTSPPAAAVTSSRRGARGPRARNHRTPNIAHQASQKYKQHYAYPNTFDNLTILAETTIMPLLIDSTQFDLLPYRPIQLY